MSKKIVWITAGLLIAALIGFVTFGVVRSKQTGDRFVRDGYLLVGDQGTMDQTKTVKISADGEYSPVGDGIISLRSGDGELTNASQESFVYYDDGSVAALCDGFLLDFNDLSDNFINNYYISANIPLANEGGTYTAETSSGTMTFGEHIWKLSDKKYLIQSPTLSVCMSEDDVRPCEEFVQVAVTPDGIVQLLTKDNLWMTISANCYIETKGGVKIYPVTGGIDSGTYKMDLRKLSVDENDGAILLTAKTETEERIIPKFNVTTIDGEDGTTGDGGKKGDKGKNGEAGIDGSDGDDGSEGAAGSAGSAGSTGGTPVNARNGVDAKDVTTTKSTIPVMQITEWNISTTSLQGTITVTDKSEFLSNFTDEEKSFYTGSVTIINEDTGEEYECWESDSATYSPLNSTEFKRFNQDGAPPVYFSTYDGVSITVLEPDTNYILSVKAYYNISGTIYQREFIRRQFCTDSSGIFLSDNSATTESVTVDVDVNEIYWNDDPTLRGIDGATVYLLTKEQAENFSYSKATSQGFDGFVYRYELDYKNETVEGYLPGKSAPVYSSEEVDRVTSLVFGGNSDINLDSDTEYVARVIIERDGLKSLSSQELAVTTLKRTPTFYDDTEITTGSGDDELKSVRSIYNRVTDCFEVYRPTVYDPDSGIVKYTYTALRRSTDSQAEYEYQEVQTQELTPAEAEPVQFNLPTGTDNSYIFRVTVEFYDNEKTIYYELGDTGVKTAVGSGLPQVKLLNSTLEDNYFTGTISISLDEAGTLQKDFASLGSQLSFRLYNDQWYEGTMEYRGEDIKYDKTLDTPKVNGVGYSIYDCRITTTDVQISVAFHKLRFNTDYSLDVTGAVDLGDGNGTVERLLGTVRFSTLTPPVVTTQFTKNETSGGAFNVNLKAGIDDTNAVDDPSGVVAGVLPYDIGEIREGRTVLKLYEGTGTDGMQIGDQYIMLGDDLISLTSDEGFNITPATFGTNLSGEEGKDYTISIYQMTEDSYFNDGLVTKYINEYTKSLSQSYFTVAAEVAAPALPTEPSGGVHADPIYVSEASLYTADTSAYEDLSDDTVIGYTLDATYVNDSLLGRKITYYAYEYTDFYDDLRGYDRTTGSSVTPSDPVGKYDVTDPEQGPGTAGRDKLMTISLDMNKQSTDVPKVAILFGGTKDEDTESSFSNGYHVYYAGEPVIEQSTGGGGSSYYKLKSGMGRGYRYVFAYTLEYEMEGRKCLYPYDHSDYGRGADASDEAAGYVKDYGIGHQIVSYERGSWKYAGPSMFAGANAVAYILNSGLQDAAYEEPVFHTYLRKSYVTGWAASSGANQTVNRAGDIGYSYEDPDGVIVYEAGGVKSRSVIMGHNSGDQYIDTEPNADGEVHWGDVPYTCTVPKGGSDVSLTVSRKLYNFDYDDILSVVAEGTTRAVADSTSMKMGHVLNEWGYGLYYNSDTTTAPGMKVETGDGGYYIDLVANNTTMENIAARGFAMKVKLTDVDDKTNYYEALLPIKYNDANYSTYYVRIAVSSLPESLIGKEYKVSGEIYYDSGDAGWYYADPSKDPDPDKDGDGIANVRYGMQYMVDNSGSFTWSRYFMYHNDVFPEGDVPSGGMFNSDDQDDVMPAGIINTIEELYDISATGAKQRNEFIMRYAFHSQNPEKYQDFDLYLYPFTCGMEASNSVKINTPVSTNYVVPKKLLARQVSFPESGGGGQVTYVVPEVNFGTDKITPTGTAIWIDEFSLNGVTKSKAQVYTAAETGLSEDCYVVSVGLYDSVNEAENHAVRTGDQGSVSERFFAVNKAGKVIAICTEYDSKTGEYKKWDSEVSKWFEGKTEYPTFTGVNTKEAYYVGFNMKIPEGGSYRTLLDHDRVEKAADYTKAVYQTETLGPVTVKINAVRYDYTPDTADASSNFGYFNKQIYTSFGLSRTTGLEMYYEVYTDEEDAKPDYDAEDMVTDWTEETRAKAVFDFSKTTGLVNGATLSKKANITKINVSPYMFRTEANEPYTEYTVEGITKYRSLIPGTKYYLRVNAVESGVCMGSDYIAFSIPKAQGYVTPTFTVPDRGEKNITFTVSCYDAISSAMGYTQGTAEESALPVNVKDKGLYTVRFGYYNDEGKQVNIPTQYDGQVFPMGSVRKKFELSEATITATSYKMQADTLYWIAVYAVNDADLKGLSYPVSVSETAGEEWDYFFGKAYEDKSAGTYHAKAFTDLVDSFFDDYKVLKEASAEAKFAVGLYSTKTTDADAIYIGNSEFQKVSDNDSVLRLKLTDSAGIIDVHGYQAFTRIDCTAKKKGGGTATVTVTDTSKMFTEDKDNDAYILDMDFSDEQFVFTSGDYYDFTVKMYTDTASARVYDIVKTDIKLD